MFRAKLCVRILPNSGKTKMTLLKSEDYFYLGGAEVQQ